MDVINSPGSSYYGSQCCHLNFPVLEIIQSTEPLSPALRPGQKWLFPETEGVAFLEDSSELVAGP